MTTEGDTEDVPEYEDPEDGGDHEDEDTNDSYDDLSCPTALLNPGLGGGEAGVLHTGPVGLLPGAAQTLALPLLTVLLLPGLAAGHVLPTLLHLVDITGLAHQHLGRVLVLTVAQRHGDLRVVKDWFLDDAHLLSVHLPHQLTLHHAGVDAGLDGGLPFSFVLKYFPSQLTWISRPQLIV